MDQRFDSTRYIAQVGQELVASFERAGIATTRGAIGSAREESVRNQLESILPNGLAVGTGFVIDSFDSVSKQTDVVIYEKDICPVFRLNNDDSVTHFPCEGVVAVGEIKSSLTTTTLIEAFAQISSVKQLRRFVATPPPNENVTPYRPYGSRFTVVMNETGGVDQSKNPTHQIFGFVLAGKLSLSPDTLCKKFVELEYNTRPEYSPNLIVTLDNHLFVPTFTSINNPQINVVPSTQVANSICHTNMHDISLQFLLSQLHSAFRNGGTTDVDAFARYFTKINALDLPPSKTIYMLQRRRSEHAELQNQYDPPIK